MEYFTNDKGKTFRVEIVRKGDFYGRNLCLIHREEEPLVEFYDEETCQFISRYYAETLLRGKVNGLCLEGGCPSWSLDIGSMMSVRAFIREELAK